MDCPTLLHDQGETVCICFGNGTYWFTRPPIKRSLHIPANMNLGYVQEVLMLAMGWEGFHLKEIRFGGITYFTRMAGGEAPEETEGFPQCDSFQYTLGDLLKLPATLSRSSMTLAMIGNILSSLQTFCPIGTATRMVIM